MGKLPVDAVDPKGHRWKPMSHASSVHLDGPHKGKTCASLRQSERAQLVDELMRKQPPLSIRDERLLWTLRDLREADEAANWKHDWPREYVDPEAFTAVAAAMREDHTLRNPPLTPAQQWAQDNYMQPLDDNPMTGKPRANPEARPTKVSSV